MQCPEPRTVSREIGPGDYEKIQVPCGQCLICKESHRQEWTFRVQQEAREARNALFLTLTYSEDTIPRNTIGEATLSKRDLQLFHKKLRQRIARDPIVAKMALKWPPLRFYAIGEYGTNTNRPHYHGIYFNIPASVKDKITDIWANGHVQYGTVTGASIHYVTGYLLTFQEVPFGIQKPFATMSKNPGIGYNYISRTKDWHTKNKYTHVIGDQGQKINLPRYYKNHIFQDITEAEQEEMELNSLKNQTIGDIKEYEKVTKNGDDFYRTTNQQIENRQRQIRNKHSKRKF